MFIPGRLDQNRELQSGIPLCDCSHPRRHNCSSIRVKTIKKLAAFAFSIKKFRDDFINGENRRACV